MHLQHVADAAFVDQALRGAVCGHPRRGPVDCEALAGRDHGGYHAVGLGKARGEGLLDEDVRAIGCDTLDPFAVARRGGAQDHEIGPQFEASDGGRGFNCGWLLHGSDEGSFRNPSCLY